MICNTLKAGFYIVVKTWMLTHVNDHSLTLRIPLVTWKDDDDETNVHININVMSYKL